MMLNDLVRKCWSEHEGKELEKGKGTRPQQREGFTCLVISVTVVSPSHLYSNFYDGDGRTE